MRRRHLLIRSPSRTPRLLGIFAVTQILSWGSLYYAFSVLSSSIQKELNLSWELVFGAFTASVLVSGLAAPLVGTAIDRWGGRPVMGVGSLLSGLGCLMLSAASGPDLLFLGWVVIGLGMAGTLYEAAFATIVRTDEKRARRTISLLTLFGGLASTAFWPLSAWLLGAAGWHGTYQIFGAAHLLVCLPLHLLLPDPANPGRVPAPKTEPAGKASLLFDTLKRKDFWLLALAFSANSFIFAALAIQLIPLLQAWRHSTAEILWMTALIGPMQVLGRVVELALEGRFDIHKVGLAPFLLLPVSFLGLWLFGAMAWMVVLFCCFYGISNGLMTIVRGVIPKERFDPAHYGLVSGLLSGFGLFFRAVGPLVFGLIVAHSPNPGGATLFLLAVAVISFLFFGLAVLSRKTASYG